MMLRFVAFLRMKKNELSLKARALRYLSLREYSRFELARKLTPYLTEHDELEQVLDWLQSKGFLSDQRFSEALVHRKSQRFGNQKILAELQQHQLRDTDLSELKLSLQESEAERATEVLHKKFPYTPVDQAERFKQMRFLQQRGFSSSSIQHAMRASRQSDEHDDA